MDFLRPAVSTATNWTSREGHHHEVTLSVIHCCPEEEKNAHLRLLFLRLGTDERLRIRLSLGDMVRLHEALGKILKVAR